MPKETGHLDIVPLNNTLSLRQAKYYTSIHNIQERQSNNVQHSSHTSHVMQERPTQEHPTQECSTQEFPTQ
ncbi:20437_t:CDS:2 [Gigaspora margarita]|uniref:20437_t:CDS:1 n=1 Tax=Gigaspora margarita TaxID=4874 RepID=A0ABN7VMD7_GIGMA|nr:20437_t:CDS:2 [Gigaspora margarita]